MAAATELGQSGLRVCLRLWHTILNMKTEQTQATIHAVEDALAAILKPLKPVEGESLPITHVLQRVLAEPVISLTNVPPFRNSAMDGYAVIAADVAAATSDAPTQLQLVETIPAGKSPTQTVESGQTARIMTGAPMPNGADTVIRFEDTSEARPLAGLPDDRIALYKAVSAGDNVRQAGEDIRMGQTILQPGQRLRPQDIGVLAAIGQAKVTVHRRPRVAILATGDELVGLDELITPGKIRNSNEYSVAAQVEQYGGLPIRLGIAGDSVEALTQKIKAGLAEDVDLFLTSAGVSVGEYDMVKAVLGKEGRINLWQVNIKPGKPLAFGQLKKGVPLIGLPGNPVAAMVAFEVFVRPAILKLGGCTDLSRPTLQATLDEDVTNSGRRHYMRGQLRLVDGQYRVSTRDSGVTVQGSGILTSLVWANCLVIVPEDVTHLPAGSTVQVWPL